MNAENTVAKVLQYYALFNVFCGLIMVLWSMNSSFINGLIVFFAVLVVSFLIYALGEIVELLYQIKCNTSGSPNSAMPVIEVEDELPEI